MNMRKKSETSNTDVKKHLEVISQATCHGADLQASVAFMKIRAAHNELLWEKYSMTRRVRQRLNLHYGKQHALANFLHEVSALTEYMSLSLLAAYVAWRLAFQKRDHTLSIDESVPGVRTARCHNTDG